MGDRFIEKRCESMILTEPLCDILIPTFNNPNYLLPCLNSILAHTLSRDLIRILIINNGAKEIETLIPRYRGVEIVHAGQNLGWEGGLKLGLEYSKSKFVCFMNDDTFVPYSSCTWVQKCLYDFVDKKVAAVGPTSNVVMGFQNIFFDQLPGYYAPVAPFLIGFCKFLRREYLDQAGGVDDTLPGGDDLDLSIRFTKAGYKLVINRDVFIFHHGFKTGERLHGSPNDPGGWNSREMQDATNRALIRKHGFRAFINCVMGTARRPEDSKFPSRDVETEVVRRFVKEGRVLELGCGGTKTVESAIGIDLIPRGETIHTLDARPSVGDIIHDVTEPLPVEDQFFDTIIARHILEHCIDTVSCLRNWSQKLKTDGKLIITVPDERITQSIPLNPEHVHAFTPSSLKAVAELVGLKELELVDNYNGVSFTSVFGLNGISKYAQPVLSGD